ncbi:MAG: c-type cytochrome [Leptolyngbyaceae cyanobacterium MAG.088]|nr:c-type cytochrome [Leptolyngbyaceae cyanobacterium MAG.088]
MLQLCLLLTKRLLPGCVAVALVASVWLSTTPMAWAEVTTPPVELFEITCAGCHPHGANIIRRGKSLKTKALKRHGYDSVDAIATLITNGKGLMSAYGDQLSAEEITSLANYVLDQAAVNWKPAT